MEVINPEHQGQAGGLGEETTQIEGKIEPGAPGSAAEERAASGLVRCKGTKKDGGACNGKALSDGYCFAHSPALAEKRKAAWARGGSGSARAARLQKLVPSCLGPVNDMLGGILKELYEHKMDARTAQAMASVARALVVVFTSGTMEDRMRKLEEKGEGNANA